MEIRILHSSLLRDYQAELAHLHHRPEEETLRGLINPNLTLKFFDLDPLEFEQLQIALTAGPFTFWSSPSATRREIIATFPAWEAMDRLRLAGDIPGRLCRLKKNCQVNHWDYFLPGGKHLQINRPLVMGVLNVTPDSFSDGGRFIRPEVAIRHAIEMEETGADIIDIGAESTRPGARTVGVEEEWTRLQPLLQRLVNRLSIPISVDTYKAEVARRALREGAGMVNDISGLTFDPAMAGVVAEAGCPVSIMHIRGKPRDMQTDPRYENLMEEIYRFLLQQISFAESAGICQLILDPGIGFGKRFEDNFEIIRRLSELKAPGYPVLLGASRKSFLGRLLEAEADRRLMGTAAATAIAVQNGANIVRVHDVREMREVCSVVTAINTKKI